jgi:superfamily II DNA helicase RecQ
VLFRSDKQKRGVEAVLVGHTPLVVVLPIGGGKSLLFMVPACLEDPGVTIIIIPFQALLGNLINRLKKA